MNGSGVSAMSQASSGKLSSLANMKRNSIHPGFLRPARGTTTALENRSNLFTGTQVRGDGTRCQPGFGSHSCF